MEKQRSNQAWKRRTESTATIMQFRNKTHGKNMQKQKTEWTLEKSVYITFDLIIGSVPVSVLDGRSNPTCLRRQVMPHLKTASNLLFTHIKNCMNQSETHPVGTAHPRLAWAAFDRFIRNAQTRKLRDSFKRTISSVRACTCVTFGDIIFHPNQIFIWQ